MRMTTDKSIENGADKRVKERWMNHHFPSVISKIFSPGKNVAAILAGCCILLTILLSVRLNGMFLRELLISSLIISMAVIHESAR